MAETKDDIAAERDALRQENEQLRGQLAAAGAGRAYQPAAQFVLSEGNRQELLAHGVTVIGGRRVTRAEVAAAIEGSAYDGVDLGDTDPPADAVPGRRSAGVLGVDFIYPSVAPGYIDPAVAGTPGISGPPATDMPMRDNELPPEPQLAFAGDDDGPF